MPMETSFLSDALAWVLPLILAVTLHEVAHGWAALLFHDDTAKRARRLSLNPLRHIDRFGTIILPGLLYLMHSPVLLGYARPVPVDFNRLAPPRTGMFCVAVAGPLTNIVLALMCGVLLHLDRVVTPEDAPLFFRMLYLSIQINCVLAALNLLPLLPLDGGRMLNAVLPESLRPLHTRSERFGFPLILLMLLLPAFVGIDLPGMLIGTPAEWLMEHVLVLTGNGRIAG